MTLEQSLAWQAALRSELASWSKDELAARWREMKGTPLPRWTSRQLAVLAVAHAIQEQESGGLDAETQKRLEAMVQRIVPGGQKPPPPAKKLRTGTRLLREWQGQVHEVIVAQDGFWWKGECHRSLSAIARQITGTRWNGWVFFGANKKDGTAQSGHGKSAKSGKKSAPSGTRSPSRGRPRDPRVSATPEHGGAIGTAQPEISAHG